MRAKRASKPPLDDDRPAPSWLGDVADGVDAWTRRTDSGDPGSADEPTSTPTSRAARSSPPPDDPVAAGPPADPESVARTILLDQLTGRARSRSELADKLAGKLVPDEIATELLDRFEEVGLIDDAAFARSWVAGRGPGGDGLPGKGLARKALAVELRRKGVADDVVREALEEVDPDEEAEAARRLVQRKLRSLSRVDDLTATRRLVGMLARKGYPPSMAFAVVKEELADREAE